MASFFLTGTFRFFGLIQVISNRFQNGFLQKFVDTYADTLAWPDFSNLSVRTDNIKKCRFFLTILFFGLFF